jgi:hypothetical protein
MVICFYYPLFSIFSPFIEFAPLQLFQHFKFHRFFSLIESINVICKSMVKDT